MDDASVRSGNAPDTTTKEDQHKENDGIFKFGANTLSKVKTNEIKAYKCADSMNEMNEGRGNKGNYLLVDNTSISSDDLVADYEPVGLRHSVKDNDLENKNVCTSGMPVKSNPNNKISKNLVVKCDSKSPSRSKWQEIEPDSDEEFDPIREIVKCSRMNSADSTTKCKGNSKSPSISDHEDAGASQKSTSPITSLPTISTYNNNSVVTCETPRKDTKTSDIVPADPNPQDTLIECGDEVTDQNDVDKRRDKKEDDERSIGDENDKKDVDDDSEDDDEEVDDDDDDKIPQEAKVNKMKEIKRKLAVKKLSSLVEKLNKKIQHLEEQELTLTDMDGDSVYTQLELYKKKFVLVWKKLCELTSQSPATGREMEKPFVFRGTNYPQINKAVTRFVNRYQAFPDYQDIHDIVSTCNEFFNLKLNKQMMSNISTSAFTSVGKSLKNRRIRDYKDNFGSHLTDRPGSERDPAMDDPELRRKLEENKRKADSNMEKAFHHFESLPAKENEESDDSDDSEDENEDDNESSREKCGKVDGTIDGSDAKLDENDCIELMSSEEEKSLRQSEKVETNSMNSSSDSASEMNYSSGKKSNRKKSLSTRYDSKKSDVRSKFDPKKKSRESSPESNDSEVVRNNSAGSRAKESKTGGAGGSLRRRASNDSTRSLRSNSSSLTPSVSESTRSAKRKAESASGPKSSKKQKIAEEPKREGPQPTFVCLMDEIKIYKTGEVVASVKTEPNESDDMIAHITKALTPSKVVLRNCMSCKVICRKSCLPEQPLEVSRNIFSKRRTSESCKEKPSGEQRKNSKATSEVGTHARTSTSEGGTSKDVQGSSSSGTSSSKKPSSRDETAPTAGIDAGALGCNADSGKQSTASPDEGKCVDLSDSEDSNADCSKNAKETEAGSVCSIFGKIVGEVLTFEECDENDISKEDEGLVKAVASLGKEARSKTDIDKQEEAKTSSPLPPAPEVVDLEEPDSKNEDGIIFVGAYKTSSALANSNVPLSTPSLAHPSHESSNTSTQSSKSRPRIGGTGMQVRTSPHSPMSKMLILAQRNKKKSHALTSTCSNSLNSGMPRRIPSSVPSSMGTDAIFPETEGDLMSKLLDPSFPTSNIRVPKLPAKVIRQISNMTKRITGIGRSKSTLKTKAFQGSTPKHYARSSFSAGAAYATASANATSKALQRRAYLEEFYQHRVPVSHNPVRKRMVRTSIRGNNRSSATARNGNYAFQNLVPETVVIDDDDPAGTPGHAQSNAADSSRPCDWSSKEVEPPRKKNRVVVPVPSLQNSAHGSRSFATSSNLGTSATLQQRKFQQKTQSSDSDVILCGIEFEGEALSIDLESGLSERNPEGPLEVSTTSRTDEKELPSADHRPVGTDRAVLPTEDVSKEASSESRPLPRDKEGSSIQSHQNPANGLSCTSLTRSLKAKTMSTDSDVILCDDTEEGIFTRDQLTSLIKDSLGRLMSNNLPSNETPETGPAKESGRVARKSPIDDNEAVILLD